MIARHAAALAFAVAALALSAAAWLALAALAAQRAGAGAPLIVVFDRALPAASAIERIDAAGTRRFAPTALANAWRVDAEGPGSAAALRHAGARLVLRADATLAFALGCATPPPASP